jgi:NADH:ubiquinone oxidoreductase subunit K
MTILSLYLILLGLMIMLYKNNYIYYLLGLELILFGLNINFLVIGTITDSYHVKKMSIYLLVLAGVETVIGLSLIVGLNAAINSIYAPSATRIKG